MRKLPLKKKNYSKFKKNDFLENCDISIIKSSEINSNKIKLKKNNNKNKSDQFNMNELKDILKNVLKKI